MALDAQILLSILAHESSSGDISRTLRATPATYSISLADGTGDNQAQVVWSDSRTHGGSNDILDTSSLADDRGTVSFTTFKAIYIRNTHASNTLVAASISIGQTGISLPSAVSIAPGGALLVCAPGAVGRPSFAITISGPSGTTYDIVLIGEGTVT